MKTNFWQFIADIIRKHDLRRRLISVLCILSLVVGAGVSLMLTLPGMTASYDPVLKNGVSEVLTDPMTNNAWIDYFKIGNGTYDTEFVGSIWTDKTVTTSYENYQGEVVAKADDGNMLGVLSAIGSSMAITGRIYTPIDVMLILDLSSSMYGASTPSPTVIQRMVDAVNESVTTLLSLNDYNRVGVTIYYGNYSTATNNGSTFKHGVTLLPLDNYEVASSYLTVLTSSGILTGVKASAKSTTSKTTVTNTHNLVYNQAAWSYVAGTYAQLGVQNARKEFETVINNNDTTVLINNEVVNRQPIYIFMSDGRPTSSHSQFATLTNPTTGSQMAEWGLDTEDWRTSDASDFVFQLTAAYSKLVVSEGYGTDALFYTLGLAQSATGKGVSMNVMDPTGTTDKTDAELVDQATIQQWWKTLVESGTVSFDVYTNTADYSWAGYTGTTTTKTVTTYPVTVNGQTRNFPYDTTQQDYVDAYFQADDSKALSAAFTAIVNEIILKSIYNPTNVSSGRVNTSGDVSFVDYIGEYMEVKEVHGILLGGELYNGERFASIFQSEDYAKSVLGTMGSATEFGMLFWNNVIQQLNIDQVYATVDENGNTTGLTVPAVAEAYNLITKCWGKQLYYKSATEWSNYLSWYADADNNYISYWDDTVTDSSPPGNAAARIKTYFFESKVSEDNTQTYSTDIMYATVWVVETLDSSGNPTGDQTVVFSVPASLLPTLKYFVKLDEDGNLISLHLGSVEADTLFDSEGRITTRPIRLVYEVGLRSDINAQNLSQKVDATYIQNNSNPDTGEVYFYSNEWERDGYYGDSDDYNTYSYFRPSTFNDRYYYVDDMKVYIKSGNEYVEYSGELNTDLDLYTKHPKYIRSENGISVGDYYMPLGDKVITNQSETMYQDNGLWYVKAGTKHELTYTTTTTTTTTTTRFVREKTENTTGTLPYRNAPTQNTVTTDYVLASTLGNNGRIKLVPDGQSLQKWLVDANGDPYPADTAQTFEFILHEGAKIEGVDYKDAKSIGEALKDSGRKYTKITLTVTQGNYQSGVVPLTGLTEYVYDAATGGWAPKEDDTPTWDCIFGHEYTIVELNTNDSYDFTKVKIGETVVTDESEAPEKYYNGDSLKHVYQFTYGYYPDGDADYIIRASNVFKTWEILLTKTDDGGTNNLPGAVFGIYSPKDTEAMTEEALNAAYPDLDFSEISTITVDIPTTETVESETWYLTQIGTTDDNGQITWSGLTQEHYYIVELSPPPGYYAPEEGVSDRWYVQRTSDHVEVTVANTPGVELPSTGGIGSEAYIFIGAAMMLTSAVLMVVYLCKRKEEPATS